MIVNKRDRMHTCTMKSPTHVGHNVVDTIVSPSFVSDFQSTAQRVGRNVVDTFIRFSQQHSFSNSTYRLAEALIIVANS